MSTQPWKQPGMVEVDTLPPNAVEKMLRTAGPSRKGMVCRLETRPIAGVAIRRSPTKHNLFKYSELY